MARTLLAWMELSGLLAKWLSQTAWISPTVLSCCLVAVRGRILSLLKIHASLSLSAPQQPTFHLEAEVSLSCSPLPHRRALLFELGFSGCCFGSRFELVLSGFLSESRYHGICTRSSERRSTPLRCRYLLHMRSLRQLQQPLSKLVLVHSVGKTKILADFLVLEPPF